jgi:hypothetical protein
VFALERAKAFVAAVTWVDIDDHEPIGANAEVCVRHSESKPPLDDFRIARSVVDTVRG